MDHQWEQLERELRSIEFDITQLTFALERHREKVDEAMWQRRKHADRSELVFKVTENARVR
jgi:hypothetical protein